MRIEKINYTPRFVENFGQTDECEKFGIFEKELIGVIFKLDNEIGFYMNKTYRGKGYMYKALLSFIKKGYSFTVSRYNIPSNNLLKKLNIKIIKKDFFYNYYLVS